MKLLNVGNINKGKLNLSATKIHLSEEEAYGKYSHFLVDDGDLLIACSGIVVSNFHHKITFARKEHLPLCMNTSTMRFKPLKENEIDLNYFRCFLQTNYFVSQLRKLITGSAQLNFGPSHIKKMFVCYPPLEEQKKIAEILDVADSIRQKDQQLVEHYDRLSQSLFLDMFGDPVTNPLKWNEELLDELCIKITDGTHHSPGLCEIGFPYVTAKHVKKNGLRFFDKPTYVAKSNHDEIYKRCAPEFGDILYIKDGATTGIACVNTFTEAISLLSSLALLKLNNDKVNNYFLCYWLNHNEIKNKLIHQYMSGAAIKRFTLNKIKSFKLIVPPIELQMMFSERIIEIEKQKELAQQSLKKSDELFNSLLQKAFKGELTAKINE
ncbi:MAG: restriction endonuclease subunit S [Psychromonas sp.]|nr:restriction endonuclease subunit S [Psychromonas sp.]